MSERLTVAALAWLTHRCQILETGSESYRLRDARRRRRSVASECLAIHVDFRLTGDDVVRVLEGLVAARGAPGSLKTDDGPEFTGRLLDLWAYFTGVALDFSEPERPTDNAFIESFNGRFR